MPTKIQLRRGTANQWTTADPTLASGEFGVETDTAKVKLGDGTTAWTSLSYFGNLEALNNVGDVTITSASSGEVLQYNGSAWVNSGLAINEVSDVTITSASSGEVLQYNGSAWVNSGLAINEVSDVTITSASNGEVLQYNGSAWVNATLDALPSQSGNSGYYLTTDGSTASWVALSVSSDPNPQIFMLMGA